MLLSRPHCVRVPLGFLVGHGSLGSNLVLSVCAGCAFAQFMTQEAAQKCLEAASPETEVRKTFPLPCNLGNCGSGGTSEVYTKLLLLLSMM